MSVKDPTLVRIIKFQLQDKRSVTGGPLAVFFLSTPEPTGRVPARMPHRARISVSPIGSSDSFASSSQGFISTFAGMEVALDIDNDRKNRMLQNSNEV
jgi:hypothetical protein